MRKWRCYWALTGILSMLISSQAMALDINEKLALDAGLAGAYQHQSLSDAPGYEDTGRGGLVFEPGLYFRLTDRDAIFAQFGFAAGNGLADGTTPFYLMPWCVNTESSVKMINGRDRDYLLTAGYWHRVDLGAGGSLDLEGGIIDATVYLDQNAYANSGLTQFMNEALVNGPNVFLPAYDLGGAALWEKDALSAAMVVMNIGKNEDDRSYNFFGAQLGYTLLVGLGEGHYRINLNKTTDDFNGPNGATDRSKTSLLISCDQEIGAVFGVWFRSGWQEDDAYINYQNLISGGLDVKGGPWGRDSDNIGIGFAFLDDGNSDIDKTELLELYYRFAINEFAAATLDFQYVEDKYTDGLNPVGLISGLRFTAAF